MAVALRAVLRALPLHSCLDSGSRVRCGRPSIVSEARVSSGACGPAGRTKTQWHSAVGVSDAAGVDDDALLDEQLAYYDDRAPIYDEAYTRTGHNDRGSEANERWWSELRIVENALSEAALGGDVLELGCGTGYWTQRLAAGAHSVTALDGSEQMLRVARQRLGNASNVTFEQVDILRGWAPTRRFDAVAAFFFIEHVPDTHLHQVLQNVARALPLGGRLFFAEGLHREPAAAIEHRQLHGHEYRVVERRRREEEFAAALAKHGFDLTFGATERLFCFVEGTRSR